MKSIKTILAAVMATAVVGATCIIPAGAYPDYDTSSASFVMSNAVVDESADPEAYKGITVTLSLANKTCVNSGGFQFTFDDTKLELTGLKKGEGFKAIEEEDGIISFVPNKDQYLCAFAAAPSETYGGAEGELVKLTFNIIDPDAKAGSVYDISATNMNDIVLEIEKGDTHILAAKNTVDVKGSISIAATTPEETTTTEEETTTTTEETTTEETTTTTEEETTTTTTATEEETTTTTTKKDTSGVDSSPKTGDTSSAAGMLAVLALAGAAAVATKKAKK